MDTDVYVSSAKGNKMHLQTKGTKNKTMAKNLVSSDASESFIICAQTTKDKKL